jgi:hypothetical protein
LYSCSVMNASSSGIHASFIIASAFSHFSFTYGSFCILILSSGVSHVITVSHVCVARSFVFPTTPWLLVGVFVGFATLSGVRSHVGSADGSAIVPPCLSFILSMKLCLNPSTHACTTLEMDFHAPTCHSGHIFPTTFPCSLYSSVASFTFFTSAFVCAFASSAHLFIAVLN